MLASDHWEWAGREEKGKDEVHAFVEHASSFTAVWHAVEKASIGDRLHASAHNDDDDGGDDDSGGGWSV